MKRNNALKTNKNKYTSSDIYLEKLIKKKKEQTLGTEKEYGFTRASPAVQQKRTCLPM